FDWHRAGGFVCSLRALAHFGRIGYWNGIESFSHVHSGDSASAIPRHTGFAQSTHSRGRHSAGADRQLADREASSSRCHGARNPSVMEWPSRLAMDVRCDSHTISTFFHLDVSVARKPTVAGKKRRACAGQTCTVPYWGRVLW